jgi:probable rRNA maturation factor
MITIRNTQRKIPVNVKELKIFAQKILTVLECPDYDLGIWITSNKTIREYNFKYRKKSRATDILSFPYHKIKAGQKPSIKTPEDKNLGDIIISAEYVFSEFQKNFQERLVVLLVHGICHLIGYDHETEQEYKKMHAKEIEIMKKTLLNKKN